MAKKRSDLPTSVYPKGRYYWRVRADGKRRAAGYPCAPSLSGAG